ncbi:MAG: hypothetical protein H0T73_19500 [Ardenticatenales bacterium]|nr:hypothetical protein [Ardenticatenales bacterium]
MEWQREFFGGRCRVSFCTAWDSPGKERYILPALLYRSTMLWGPSAIGEAEMGRTLEIAWWRWALNIKHIVHPLHLD